MNVISFVKNISRNVNLILKSTHQDKKELLLTYLKLKLKYLFFTKILRLHITDETIFGFKVRLLNYQDFMLMFEEIFVHKDYQFPAKSDCPVIVDCGSNIGMALIFFKKLYPDSKITAFEPNKRTFEVLKKNIESNKLKSVKLFNKAIYNSEGTINFYYDMNRPGSPLMATKDKGLFEATEEVDSVLLSDYIKGNVDFVKMDIEGDEDSVIEELSHQNKLNLIKEMVIEYHHSIDEKGDRLSKILKILVENGFGYQANTFFKRPFAEKKCQDRLIRAYQKA